MHLSIGSAQMDKQSSQELLSESKVAGFSRVQKPKLATAQLQLLPYDVLRDILSQLSIKDVVRMSTLSLEWKLLRICHPELVFTKHTFGISTDTNTDPDLVSKDFFSIIKDMDTKRASWAPEFIANVDSVLHPLWSTCTTTTTTLDKFAVEFGLCRMHKYHIDRWVSFSIASRAKHIAFDFTFDVNFFGPGCDQYKRIRLILTSCARSTYLSRSSNIGSEPFACACPSFSPFHHHSLTHACVHSVLLLSSNFITSSFLLTFR